MRRKIIENFELATQPGTPREEVRRVVHFVVIGGGPTGAWVRAAGASTATA